MKDILRVLVPIDFSAESEFALEWAQWVAKGKTGATLYLLHALPLKEKPGQLGMASIAYQMDVEAVQKKMKAWTDRVSAGLLVFTLCEKGPVSEAVARVCEEKNIDLVIMTTRGRRGLTHVLEGSTTEETVRLAPCPVLVLHLNEKTQILTRTEPLKQAR